jgi:phospholipid N-methyltransferase
MADTTQDVFQEVASFKNAALWEGGFLDCDPLVSLSWSSYTTNGFISIYHAMYMAAIKPYLPQHGNVLEIGPGHGAWTKALINAGASKVCALDVQSREFNGIDKWLGADSDKLDYHVVSDLLCNEVEDNSIDFFWSFGAFVHMSENVQKSYIDNIFRKMRIGAHGFIQYADIDIWNQVVSDPAYKIHDLLANVLGDSSGALVREICERSDRVRSRDKVEELVKTWDVVAPGRYYYVGESWIKSAVEGAGFSVKDTNFLAGLRDPVIHFSKL